MHAAVLPSSLALDAFSHRSLERAAKSWFLTAVAGQWVFALYVAVFYGGAALHGDLAHWNLVLPQGYVEGETFGNGMVAAHLALAFLVLVGGPLQFVAGLRSRLPVLHRWNGRAYLVTTMTTAAVGLYMITTRGSTGDVSQHVAVCFNAVLILMFGAFAWHAALSRDFAAHRRWVLRLFLAVGGVWFFRVGFTFWVAVNDGPAGFDPRTFTGPALTILAFAQTLLPLALLELYFRAQEGRSIAGRVGMAATLVAVTAAMAFGTFVAANVMWLPRL
ncbi:MAG TPA: DUF2306 domain-containing protein [Steroidobacteraceae bacterium]|nr:DUF2306 domain-containing protein [Steroidobacteraceae bacterium]